MRSRFTGYAITDLDHVFRTWHPRTRPAQVPPTPGINWKVLEILDTEAGGTEDEDGVVEFVAHFTLARQEEQHARAFPLRAARRALVLRRR